jgi:2-polyprenyl-3-methyl-5-hydroxy-6-metoxy-1,4-benzoquinol methylase
MQEKFARAEKCPICSSRRFRFYKQGTFDYALLDTEQIKITDSEYGKIWDLKECLDCGHIFADPYPKPEFIFSLYSRVEDPAYDQEAEGRSKNFLGILKELEKRLPDKGPLFDVGAATGILLQLARARGWTPSGIEASAWAVTFAAEKRGISLVQGFFEETSLAPGSFRAVTMVDFIEHTPKPREAVRKAHEILAPGGILCLVTPDVHSPAARIAGKRWWHLRPGHLAYFSEKSLIMLLEDAGFEILKRKRYAWTFSAHYLLSRKKIFDVLTKKGRSTSFLKRIPIKLALRDSFEIYAKKDARP